MRQLTLKRTKTEQNIYLYYVRIPVLVRNLMFEFLSNLYQGLISMEESPLAFSVIKIIENDTFSNFIRPDNAKNTYVILSVENKEVLIHFRSYWENNETLYHEVSMNSEQNFNYESYDFYEYLLANAIYHSEFKGAYINIEDNDFQNFHKHEMPERSFDDIYLPAEIIKDLKSYTTIFEKRNRLLRYLFVGVPGCGKTESLIVLANELKKKGVTVLKTSAAAIKNAVKFANILAPSLIVLDDVDLELGNRENYSQTNYLKDFLDVLDGVEKINENVGMIATTNSLWLVDTAAQRPGRFNNILFFGELEEENIIRIIQKSLRSIEMDNYKVLYEAEVIQAYVEYNSTGAYIYNMTQMLANQIYIGDIEPNPRAIVGYISYNNETLKKMKRSQGMGAY
ncbi:MAG TPA: hypothetical protein DCM08_08155 [Microscillaceae bacterium]|nr:hypothetical protein [Microscillaceae bacterium]